MGSVKVATEFYPRLANRNERQGDGKHTAIDFRMRYLGSLDSAEAWHTAGEPIIFDFDGVKKIGPSFANEAFAYFTKYATPMEFLERVHFTNISEVFLLIIREELESGYKGR